MHVLNSNFYILVYSFLRITSAHFTHVRDSTQPSGEMALGDICESSNVSDDHATVINDEMNQRCGLVEDIEESHEPNGILYYFFYS